MAPPQFYNQAVGPMGLALVGLMVAARVMLGSTRRLGAQVAHVGVVVMVLGIVGSSVFRQEQTLQMKAGETAKVGRYTLTFEGLQHARGSNYVALEAVVRASSRGGLTELRPQKRVYAKHDQFFSEVAIRPSWAEDLYVALLGWDEGGVAFAVIVNPLVSWIWLGAGAMAVGG